MMINIKQIKSLRLRLTYIILGIGSTIWFLVRVIPKPSRAAYPCMRTAAPLASSFVLYLLGLTGSFFFFKKTYTFFQKRKVLLGLLTIPMIIGFISISLLSNSTTTSANPKITLEQLKHLTPNQPMGEAKGIFPGRVVWVHDSSATNPECDPTEEGNSYWEDENSDQSKVNTMLSEGLQQLTGAQNDADAWDSVFIYHNLQTGKGKTGYADDEIIFIKINCTSTWSGNINLSDFSRVYNEQWYSISETSPHVIIALLSQLINEAGVPEENIYIGDPLKYIYQDIYEKWKSQFPNVHYLDHAFTYDGREVVVPSDNAVIKYSDIGSILDASEDHLYTIFEDANYILNIPTMKGHRFGGVTMFAKNHFGSHTREDSYHLHPGLVKTADTNPEMRTDYGMYRVQVDIMGHELLGKKNLVFIMDALYSTYYELAKPVKWDMEPFHGHWTSSLFLSFDPVAIESVGFDILYAEFDGSGGTPAYARMGAVDDYLEQAADSANWPDTLVYDPEGDGTIIGSLGVHEHWDSPENKKYSRNLGVGDGIELLYVNTTLQSNQNHELLTQGNSYVGPNPFNDYLIFDFSNYTSALLKVEMYDIFGQCVLNTSFTSVYYMDEQAVKPCMIPGYYLYVVYSDGKMIHSGKLLYRP